MKVILVFIALFLLNANLPAQEAPVASHDYEAAVGLRAGYTSGLTLKRFNSRTQAIEVILGLWAHGIGLTGLYERHQPAFSTPGFQWYYGAGAHATIGTSRTRYAWYNSENRNYRYGAGMLGLGIDGIIGLEYKIREMPLALSIDLKPFVEVNMEGVLLFSPDPSVGIKLAF